MVSVTDIVNVRRVVGVVQPLLRRGSVTRYEDVRAGVAAPEGGIRALRGAGEER